MTEGRPTDWGVVRRLSTARQVFVAVSVVALVTASVVAAGATVTGRSGDVSAVLDGSTPEGQTTDALNETTTETTTTTTNETTTTTTNETTTTTTNETTTTTTTATVTTTTTTSELDQRDENERRRENGSRPPKKTTTTNETTQSGGVTVMGESNDNDGQADTEPPDDPADTENEQPSDSAASGLQVRVQQSELSAVDAVVQDVMVRNAEAHQSVSVDVSPPESRGDVTFDAVRVTPTTNTSFTLNVTASAEPIPGQTPATNLSNATKPLAFVSVDHSIADRNVSNVTFRFRVRRERVNASELDDVALYRYHGESWNELPTTLVNVTDTHFVYRVRSPGLSEFAAGKQMPQFEITDAGFEFTTLSVGEALEVRVRITNDGDADGTFTADLVLDNETVASHRLTIAADGMRQTSFERRVAEPGTYEVYVNDFRVGEVTVNGSAARGNVSTSPVESVDTVADTDVDAETDRETTTEVPGFGLWTTVGSLVAALVAVFRLRPK